MFHSILYCLSCHNSTNLYISECLHPVCSTCLIPSYCSECKNQTKIYKIDENVRNQILSDGNEFFNLFKFQKDQLMRKIEILKNKTVEYEKLLKECMKEIKKLRETNKSRRESHRTQKSRGNENLLKRKIKFTTNLSKKESKNGRVTDTSQRSHTNRRRKRGSTSSAEAVFGSYSAELKYRHGIEKGMGFNQKKEKRIDQLIHTFRMENMSDSFVRKSYEKTNYLKEKSEMRKLIRGETSSRKSERVSLGIMKKRK